MFSNYLKALRVEKLIAENAPVDLLEIGNVQFDDIIEVFQGCSSVDNIHGGYFVLLSNF